MNKNESRRIPKTSGIYLIINPKGKKYVGQSKNLKKRYKDYLQESWLKNVRNKSKIKHSFMKYGSGNHYFEILEEIEIQFLEEREERWITILDTLKNGLNTIDRNYTIFEFKRKKGETKPWSKERKKQHAESIKAAAAEGSYKKSRITKSKLSKAKKGQVTAWDLKNKKFVVVSKDEFRLNEHLVGTTSKKVPQVKRKPKKPIIDLTTGIVYEGVRECVEKLGKSTNFIYAGLKEGHFEYC